VKLPLPAGFAAWSMLLAVVLMVSAPDHWGVSVPASHSHGADEHAQASAAGHSRHCHGDAATCSDLPVYGLSGFAALEGWASGPLRLTDAGRAANAFLPWRSAVYEPATPPPQA